MLRTWMRFRRKWRVGSKNTDSRGRSITRCEFCGSGSGGIAVPEIGERMITRDPDITRLLNRLEDRGFVERNRDKQDRRVIYGKITATGLKLLREMDGPIDKRGREMLRHVGQEKLKELIELLELVRGGKAVHRRDAEGAE